MLFRAAICDDWVVQQGSHAVLVAAEGGKYSELWHSQAQYYTKNTTVH